MTDSSKSGAIDRSAVTSEMRSQRRMDPSPRDLFGQTLRTVAILLVACILFVGALSAAVLILTSKAIASPVSADSHDLSPAAPKKPLSI